MRTVKIVYTNQTDATSSLQIETEVIVDGETDPHEAGAEAARFLIQFQAGISEGAGQA